MSETARQAAADVVAEINGMTFSEDDGNESWSDKVRPIIERAIAAGERRGVDGDIPLRNQALERLREENANLRQMLSLSLLWVPNAGEMPLGTDRSALIAVQQLWHDVDKYKVSRAVLEPKETPQ